MQHALAPEVRATVEAALAAVPPGERIRFLGRLERHLPQIAGPLAAIYGDRPDVDLAALVQRLALRAAAGFVARPADLRVLDARREVDPTWFLRPDRIGYVAYVDRFAGSIKGVRDRFPLLRELGVSYLHLMSVLRPREGASDGGFAVLDYGDVDHALGTWEDLAALAADLRAEGISLCLDLVMNHTAAEHRWAELARQGSERHRAYYLVFPDRTEPDRYEQALPEVFPEMAPGNFTWDEGLQAWVWTTFNRYQWDLNYANPDVVEEMLGVMLGLANVGAEILRLDAIAFTWKRMGTDCQNQPEAHLLAQVFRALMAVATPAVVLKAEAIVPPRQLVPYLGAHDQLREECHLAYHNQLMVMLWSSLAQQDARLAVQALENLPPTPPTAAFATYVRCHDDIGWAVDDADAVAAGIDPVAHRRWLADFYRGDAPGSWARGAAFSANAENGDERTSGTAAALCGITVARERGDDMALELAVRRLLLAHAVAFAFSGVPLLYMGDELALDNDASYLDDPALAEDSRWMHRPWLGEEELARRHVPGTVEHRVFQAMVRLTEVRRTTASLTAGGETYLHRYDDPAVLAFERRHPVHGRCFCVANVSGRHAQIPAEALVWSGVGRDAPELLGWGQATVSGGALRLAPLGVGWFSHDAGWRVLPAASRA